MEIYPVFPVFPAFVLLILILFCFSWLKTSINSETLTKLSHLVSERQSVNMVNRICRDCPIPKCGAKYLVKLSNHLADVHLMSSKERKPWLQEAKLQPQVKVIVYLEPKPTGTSSQASYADIFYQPYLTRKPHELVLKRKMKNKHSSQTPCEDIIYRPSLPRKPHKVKKMTKKNRQRRV